MSEDAKKIEQFVNAEQFMKDVNFSDSDLTDAMMQQASLFAFYATQNAKAQFQLNNQKMLLDYLESKIDNEIRAQAIADKEKITEKKIEAQIKADRRYLSRLTKLNEARMAADLAKDSLEAFKHRRDMLIQLGAAQREEMKGELRMSMVDMKEQLSQDKRQRALEVAGKKAS